MSSAPDESYEEILAATEAPVPADTQLEEESEESKELEPEEPPTPSLGATVPSLGATVPSLPKARHARKREPREKEPPPEEPKKQKHYEKERCPGPCGRMLTTFFLRSGKHCCERKQRVDAKPIKIAKAQHPTTLKVPIIQEETDPILEACRLLKDTVKTHREMKRDKWNKQMFDK